MLPGSPVAFCSAFKPPTNSTGSASGAGWRCGCVSGSHLSRRPPHGHLSPGVRQLSQGHPLRTFLSRFLFSDSASALGSSPSLVPLFARLRLSFPRRCFGSFGPSLRRLFVGNLFGRTEPVQVRANGREEHLQTPDALWRGARLFLRREAGRRRRRTATPFSDWL